MRLSDRSAHRGTCAARGNNRERCLPLGEYVQSTLIYIIHTLDHRISIASHRIHPHSDPRTKHQHDVSETLNYSRMLVIVVSPERAHEYAMIRACILSPLE